MLEITPITTATAEIAQRIQRCLATSGMLAHRRRCYEDARLVTLADVQELLAQSALTTWLLRADDEVQGFAVTAIVNRGDARMGQLHFFVAHPAADHYAAEMLLTRLQQYWSDERVTAIRQARLDPISGIFRGEQDRALLALFAARGFVVGEVAGNMEIDARAFGWTEASQARADVLHARGITIRPANATDARGISALNHAEDLALWDYHLQATTVFERMHVAVHVGRIVGYANFFAARWDTDLPEFGPLLVASEHRKAGLGRVLTERALQYARIHGKQRVRLSTLRPTFAFYRALGFEVTVTWQEQLWKELRD